MVVFFRYFDRATTKEELHITPNLLSLIEKSFFRYSAKQFDVSKISSFGYSGKIKYPRHPLTGNNLDYFGFQAVDTEIQTLYEDGRISFFYEGKVYKFGKELVNWEVEEIVSKIEEVISNNLAYDDLYEKDILQTP